MGVGFLWLVARAVPADVAAFQPAVLAALAASQPDADGRAALAAWASAPDALLPRPGTAGGGAAANAFDATFVSAALCDLCQRLAAAPWLAPDRTTVVVTDRIPATAALAFALGAAGFPALPGRLGCFALDPGDVAVAALAVTRAMEPRDARVSRAWEWLRHGNNSPAEAAAIVDALPDAMAAAARDGHGVVSVCSWLW